jgi:hypothetical protein
MKRFHWITAAVLLAGMGVLGATPARADVTLALSITAGATTDSATYDFTTNSYTAGPTGGTFTQSSGGGVNSLSFNGTINGVLFTLAVTGVANNPGTATSAFLNLNTSTIINNSGATSAISVTATAGGFTLPVGPAIGNFSSSGTLNSGSISGLTFSGSAGNYTPANIGPFNLTGTGSASGTDSPTFIPNFPGALTYAASSTLGGTLGIGANTSNLGTALNVSATAVPEPGTIAMTLTALPLLGLGAWARRRRTRA